jgi:hypothetical protein
MGYLRRNAIAKPDMASNQLNFHSLPEKKGRATFGRVAFPHPEPATSSHCGRLALDFPPF